MGERMTKAGQPSNNGGRTPTHPPTDGSGVTKQRIDSDTWKVTTAAVGDEVQAMILCRDERAARDLFDDLMAELMPSKVIEKAMRTPGRLRIDLLNGSVIHVGSALARGILRGRSLHYVVAHVALHPSMEEDARLTLMANGGELIKTHS